MYKILVTGGAGYIGSIMVDKLLQEGYEVTVFDNFLYKQNSLFHLGHHDKLSIIRGDITDLPLIKEVLSKADIIIPLAALVGAPVTSLYKKTSRIINYEAPIEMFNQISKNQLVLMPTTNSAYGSGSDNEVFDEESKLNPISNYAIDKVDLEKKLLDNQNSISFRLATAFGCSPRLRLDLLVNDFTYRALSQRSIILFESHFKRNFIHVQDIANVFIHAIKNFNVMKNNIFNIGLSDANLSKKELCLKIQEYVNEFEIIENNYTKDPDQRNYVVSNKKIESYGFKPSYSLDFGIKELIRVYDAINNSNYYNV